MPKKNRKRANTYTSKITFPKKWLQSLMENIKKKTELYEKVNLTEESNKLVSPSKLNYSKEYATI